jgi:hypothetical protein
VLYYLIIISIIIIIIIIIILSSRILEAVRTWKCHHRAAANQPGGRSIDASSRRLLPLTIWRLPLLCHHSSTTQQTLPVTYLSLVEYSSC